MEAVEPYNVFLLKKEWSNELQSILSYWMANAVDVKHGGFFGSINNENIPDIHAPKGLVLHSRILWTFSIAYRKNAMLSYKLHADCALQYILEHFVDKEFGGMYWSVDAKGNMLDGKKQVYGLAFAIYGLVEYYKITYNSSALQTAKDLYQQIELHSFDEINNGYIEAFARNWTEIGDLRLSAKDSNERKTMNTHLHVIESYANLYTVWPDEGLKQKIENLLFLFDKYFINHENFHLHLFFNDAWQSKSALQSYGHDIEAAWLLQQCAEIIQSEEWISRYKLLAVPITNAAAEGLDDDGGLWYEFELSTNELIKEKHSWPQAEAMIGFMNAYELTGNTIYLDKLLNTWSFVKKYLKDNVHGEWFWGVYQDYSLMDKDKAGFWKCPYHNSRCFIELIERMNRNKNLFYEK
jgi:mannobiose 2-epimerase